MSSAAAYVDHAKTMARFLEDQETARVGDREIARSQLERRWGVASSIFYSLRYKHPKTIAADIYASLCLAVEECASRQIKALEHDVFTARTSGRPLNEGAAREAELLSEELKAIAAMTPGGVENDA